MMMVTMNSTNSLLTNIMLLIKRSTMNIYRDLKRKENEMKRKSVFASDRNKH
jgi:hypothetical protein